MTFRKRMFELSKRLMTEEQGQATIPGCPPDSFQRSRPIVFDPNIFFVTIFKVAAGGAKADVPFNFPLPCNWIMVASIDLAHISDSLFFHFKPLNKGYAGNGITPNGTESWLPLMSQTAGQTKVGIGYRFGHPLPINCFLDIGQEAGGTDYNITFAVGNDVVYWNRS